jgi:acetyl esterase/lipase
VAAALAALPAPLGRDLVAAAQAAGVTGVAELVEVLRRSRDAYEPTDEDLTQDGAYDVSSTSVTGPAGGPAVSLLVCTPTSLSASARPTLYSIHGGGMVAGGNRSGLLEQLTLARQVDAVVVSVEYRLAPEHPAPAPAEDCYAGLLGFLARADEFDADPGSLIVVGGSAGGGLAAAVCLMARDRGGPPIAGQLLMTPMLDARNNSLSSRQMAGVDTWDHACNDLGWRSLLGDRDPDALGPYDSPALADDLSGLPPTLLDVGSAETFRDEVVAYASRIWAAGGVAELHVWPGGFHGYDSVAPQSRIARLTWEARASWLRRLATGEDLRHGVPATLPS